MAKKKPQPDLEVALHGIHLIAQQYTVSLVAIADLPKELRGESLRVVLDLVNLVLMTRAEVEALTSVCHEYGLFDREEFAVAVAAAMDRLVANKLRLLEIPEPPQ
jgi:hypothetical protein